MTMPELAAELASATGTRADPASLSRWLIRNGYRFKKTLLAGEQDRADIKAAREEWTTTRQPHMRLEPYRLIFLDVSLEHAPLHRGIDDEGGGEPVAAQAGDEGSGHPMPERCL
jgi:hypothetical protein